MRARQEINLQYIEKRIIKLETEILQTIQKIKLLTHQTAIRYMETDLVRLEKEIEDLKQKHRDLTKQKSLDLDRMKAKLFGLLFDSKSTFTKIGSLHQNYQFCIIRG